MSRLPVRRCFELAVQGTSLLAALPTGYLAMITLAGLPRPRSTPTGRTDHRFVILMPADNEAAGIASALDSMTALDYPADRFSVHVVADNCSDDTLTIAARCGAEGHERIDPEAPGKGPALNWLLDRLVARDEQFDAVVVIDADTIVDDQFLRQMSAALANGATAAQGRYSVREVEASPAVSFRWAALACRHHLRPLGRCRLGASSGLYGNGMVFLRPLIVGRRWSGHLVEDAEFQMDLLLDGHDVAYVPGALVLAEMPTSLDQATSQNERWERGRIELVRRFVPTLLRRLPGSPGRRVQFADAVADHLVPPLSALMAAHLAVAGLAGVGAVAKIPGTRSAARMHALAAGAIIGHVLAGLYSVRAPRHHVIALLRAPGIVVWKVRLWLSVLVRGEEVTWTRTERNRPDSAESDR